MLDFVHETPHQMSLTIAPVVVARGDLRLAMDGITGMTCWLRITGARKPISFHRQEVRRRDSNHESRLQACLVAPPCRWLNLSSVGKCPFLLDQLPMPTQQSVC